MKKSILLAPAVAAALVGFGAFPAMADTTPTETPTESPSETPTETAEPTLTVDPTEISAEDLVDTEKGVNVTVTGLEVGSSVTNSPGDGEYEANAEGIASFSIYYDGPASDFEPGQVVDFTVDATAADGEAITLEGSFTIAGAQDDDDADDDANGDDDADDQETSTPTPTEEPTWEWNGGELQEGLNISDDVVSPADFVDEGVTFAVLGCEPGQDVTFSVSTGGNVEPYEAVAVADENGIAVEGVKGLNASNADAYIGEYTVVASCGDQEWTGSFTVGYGDDSDGGSDEDESGDSGNAGDLPRTGTELTGLAAGAGLLILGAATVFLTRRNAAKNGPADI